MGFSILALFLPVSHLLPIRRPALCYVTNRREFTGDAVTATKRLLEKIESAAKSGVDWIQIREKDLSGRELAGLVTCARQSAGSASKLLVNDRLDVAWACGADGVHLGENALPVSEARRFTGQQYKNRAFLVGASVHSLASAQQAEADGADYLIFGPVFATPSKAGFGTPQGLEKLQVICRRVEIPVLAIGGITLENAQKCLTSGARGIAAIRLFQEAPRLKDLVAQLKNAI